MLKTATGPKFSFQADKEYPVDKEVAEGLVNSRAAVIVEMIKEPKQEEPKQEEPKQEEPELKPHATKAPGKKRPGRS